MADEMSTDTPLDARVQAAGIEVYFSLAEIVELLQVGDSNLRWLLNANKHLFAPPTYRRSRNGRRFRVVSATDVKRLQQLLFERGHCQYSGRKPTRSWSQGGYQPDGGGK